MADDTETKTERGRAAITTAAQRTTGAIQEGAGRMADAGHTSSDIARQTAAATAETVRHLGDTASETARAGSRQVAGVQQKFTQNAARDFDQSVSRIAQVLQEMAPDWRALVQVPGVGSGKLRDLAVTMSSALERVMEVNLSAAEQCSERPVPWRCSRSSIDSRNNTFMRCWRAARPLSVPCGSPRSRRSSHLSNACPSESNSSAATAASTKLPSVSPT